MKRKEVLVAVAGSLVAFGVVTACGGGQSPGGDSTQLTQPEPSDSSDPAGTEAATTIPTREPSTEEPAAETPRPTSGQSSGASGEADALLAAHNRVRAKHCARPLAWSPALAATAQEWANALRDSGCKFEHSQTAYGENLAAGTRLTGENAVELWYAESEKYSYKKQGFSPATGHFTQVVWAGTRNLGCGFSDCQGMRLWVCHYDPPGNVLSLFPDNVSPATCK